MNTKADLERMIQAQVIARGISDASVLNALRSVPREKFIPAEFRQMAYEDHPVSIGHGQTISQPYIVAYMISAVGLRAQDKVLEIGTGCGYNAAVMSRLAREVYSIERIPALSQRARETLQELGCGNIHLRVGDGYKGWPEAAPFDVLILTAAPPKLPEALLDQLAEGGRLIVPEGEEAQVLRLYRKSAGKISQTDLISVRFVPMLKNK